MTQLPTWHGEPLPPTGALASAGAGREPAHGPDSTSTGPAREPREPGSTAPPVPGQRAAPGVVIGAGELLELLPLVRRTADIISREYSGNIPDKEGSS